MLDKIKTALVLLIIGAISGISIAVVYNLTEQTISDNRDIRLQQSYKDIFNLDDSINTRSTVPVDTSNGLQVVEIYNNDTDQFIGYVYLGEKANNFGNVSVLVGVLEDGIISKVIISETANTAKYVLATKTDYLPGFTNVDINDVEFDAFSSATYTSGSVNYVIDLAKDAYQESVGE